MKTFVRSVVLASLGLATSSAFAKTPCENPYLKSVPFKRTVSAQHVDLTLFNEARFVYDCESLVADNRGGINLAFYKLNADIFTVQAGASQGEGDAELTVRTLLLGYELANERKVLSSLYDKTFQNNQDLDISDTMIITVGPMPVQVRYGIEGTGNVRVTAGLKKIGTQLAVIPAAKVRAYVQAGADVKVVSAAARGDLNVFDGKLDNTLAFTYKSKDRRHGAHVSARALVDFTALEGTVGLRAELQKGKDREVFEKDLFSWGGQHIVTKAIEFSQDIPFSAEAEQHQPSNVPQAEYDVPDASLVSDSAPASLADETTAMIGAMENR